MKYSYEAVFEKGEREGWFVVEFPDIDPIVTEGFGVEDAILEASDALELFLVDNEIRGLPVPTPTTGHRAEDGFVKLITIEPRPRHEVVKWVTTREAATILNVTPSRVRQLVLSGKLRGKLWGRDRMVSLASVDVYKAEPRKVGRPRKATLETI